MPVTCLLQRWYFNATIECFNEAGHIVLGIWAIFVLIFCLLLVPFVGIVSKRVLKVGHFSYLLVFICMFFTEAILAGSL